MSADPARLIDWTHEREWRWVDHGDECSCPGVPIWLAEEPVSFSRVLIVVRRSSEARRVVDLLQQLYDAGANDFDHPFCRTALEATSVTAIEWLEGESDLLRLEDIRAEQIQTMERPAASRELMAVVREVIEEARTAANEAARRCYEAAPRTGDDGHVADIAGWAHLMIYGAQSPVVAALLELNEIYSTSGSGYCFRRIGGLGWRGNQAMCLAEAAVEGARAVFERHFPDESFGMDTRWD